MKKNLFLSLLVVATIWSCSKDDEPASPKKLENNAPKIEAQSFGVKENIDDTAPIGKVEAKDDDIKDDLEFEIIEDTDALFEITAISGVITLRQGKSLDVNKATTHKITVEVDDGTDQTSAEITINVGNFNVAPEIDEGFLVFEVLEDASEIGKVVVEDADGDQLSFKITGNTEDNLFEIADNGLITLAEGKNLDYEFQQEYTIEIAVSDGELEASEEVKIIVLNVIDTLKDDPGAFVTTWIVQAGGIIGIGTNDAYNYDFTIDWGDGSDEEQITEQNPEHQYTHSGIYTVSIKGQFPALFMNNNIYAPNLLSVERWGNNVWESFNKTFFGCNQMEYNATDAPNLKGVTDLSYMFAYASKFNGDLGHWDVSNVTNMENMFLQAAAFDGNIGLWGEKTGNVENMRGMFAYADVFNQDLSAWDVSKVQNMSIMFLLTQEFNQNLSDWNTISVTNYSNMFNFAIAFDQNLGAWDMGNAEFMNDMFNQSGMSASSYSATLVGWASNENADIPDGMNLDDNGQGLAYCMDDLATVEALAKLTADNLWTINTDNGINCN